MNNLRTIKLAENLELVDETVKCSRCGRSIGPSSENWKDHAFRRSKGSEDGLVKLHGDLSIFEYYCPSCGVLLDVEIARKSETPLWDIHLARKRNLE